MKKLYILGGEGFIGLNLVEYFTQNDLYEVILISKRPTKFSFEGEKKIKRIYTDIYDCNFELEKKSIVIHLARSTKNSLELFEKKEENLKRYITSKQPQKIIVFSSSVLYTQNNTDYKEEKKILEKIWNKESFIFRLFNTYGKYQYPNVQGSFITILLYNALTGNTTNINTINQSRNFIYAGDIGKVILYIVQKYSVGIYDIGYEDINFRELINNYMKPYLDFEKIKINGNDFEEKAPQPKKVYQIEYTSIQDGLEKTNTFIQKNLETYLG